ncbi:hypothetical protein EDEG_02026 [Edhazardia aedis USNM 41457]|uniref:3'-phosphate/5'-hydroxy nucleic acid ligase n=1 Tax=Edhazardia aedis (strain USNM 41457) TaxID=1003232 RepID=J9DM37_EDHAE|nr:hypothetical protein EDEG_02026 [Edhazardia aedis USNM 41457]|eukprot:EJW03655.1 hypothetical protein EDEG_02026 [Edhazardia aedis USNM 41457]
MLEHLKHNEDNFVLSKSYKKGMNVEPILYINEKLLEPLCKEHSNSSEMNGFTQLANIASLPSVTKVVGLPDLHCGYGFPIGSVAAFDLSQDECVVSPFGVGFDINCGVRCVATSLDINTLMKRQNELADILFQEIPVGMYHESNIKQSTKSDDKTSSINDCKFGTSNDNKEIQSSDSSNVNKYSNINTTSTCSIININKVDDASVKNVATEKNSKNDGSQNLRLSSEEIYERNGLKTFFPGKTLNLEVLNQILEHGLDYLVNMKIIPENEKFLVESSGKMESNSRLINQKAKARGIQQLGSLGTGNHYLEIQKVSKIYDNEKAKIMGIYKEGQIVFSIHTGSRGLGHVTCQEYLKKIDEECIAKSTLDKKLMLKNGKKNLEEDLENINFANRATNSYKKIHDKILQFQEKKILDNQVGFTSVHTQNGTNYYTSMCAASNFAFANRALIDQITRKNIQALFPQTECKLIYDVCHNIAKKEKHVVDNHKIDLLVHRKGASRSFPPFHAEIPDVYQNIGQPVIIGGSMGTCSYILTGCDKSMEKSLGSACHGAGRVFSRAISKKMFNLDDILADMHSKDIVVRSLSGLGLIEEAPNSYKDVNIVVDVCENADIARKVCQLEPVIVIKG